MRLHGLLALSGLLFTTPLAIAQATGTCAAPFSAALSSGSALNIESLSSGIELVGTEKDGIRITCTVDNRDPQDIHIRLTSTGDFGKLAITGPQTNNLHIRVEVPRQTGIKLHMGAGQVVINQLTGDKEIDLYAGEVIISNVNPSDYNRVQASVKIGDVNAAPFGTEKGGFFRSLSRDNPKGHYRLRISVGTGSIKLQ